VRIGVESMVHASEGVPHETEADSTPGRTSGATAT
jgi:hypothetical protein